jgi:DNA polymerase-3 subunit alpha
MNDMVHLHNHTDFSLLDGAQRCSDLAKRCKEMGHVAVAQTDHGTMRGFFKFFRACEKAGIKPIYGMEAYLCRDRHKRGLDPSEIESATNGISGKKQQKEAVKDAEKQVGVRERFHTCLFAKNDVGLRNLFKLSSIGWLEGFYYRPRIDLESIIQYREGLVLTSACTSGILAHLLNKGQEEEMIALAENLKSIFADDFFLEIMPHDFDQQREVNTAIVKIGDVLDIPIVATNDAHYALAEHWQLHDVLLAMQTKAVWSDPKRWHFTGRDFYLKSRQEMEESFARAHPDIPSDVVAASLDNTLLVAEKCDVHVVADSKQCLLPHVDIAERHRIEFLEWATEMYPELYLDEGDVPSVPCACDSEAPSIVSDRDDDGDVPEMAAAEAEAARGGVA